MAGNGKKLTAEELLEVLSDSRVRYAFSQIFADQISTILDSKLTNLTSTLESISSDPKQLHQRCDKLADDNEALVQENKTLVKDLSELMEYTRRDDLVIYGVDPGPTPKRHLRRNAT